MGTPAGGFAGQFALDDSTFDTNSECYDIQSEDITNENNIIIPNGARGTRSQYGGNAVEGLVGPTRGPFSTYPTPTMLDRLLPWILGTPEATDVFAVAESLPAKNIMIDRVSKVFTYSDNYVNSATFRSATGELLMASIDVIGKTETVGNAGTFPSITPPVEDPYVHHDSAGEVTILGATREIMESTITINNACQAIFRGSKTPQHIKAFDRMVEWTVLLGFTTDEVDLLAGDVNGATGSIKYVQGSKSCLFTFGKLHIPKQKPTGIRRAGEILYPVRMRALWDGTTREIVVTNDNT